jgi:hypothetical protein
MSGSSDTPRNSRWWENYVVRYFLGSSVGFLCVGVMVDQIFANVRSSDLGLARFAFNFETSSLLTQNIQLAIPWTIAGFVFSTISGAPITVFHVARGMPRNLGQKFSQVAWLWIALGSVGAVIAALCNISLVWLDTALGLVAIYIWVNQWLGIFSLLDDEFIVPNIAMQSQPPKSLVAKVLRMPIDTVFKFQRRFGNCSVENRHKVKGGSFEVWTQRLIERRDVDYPSGLRETYTHLREHSNAVFVLLCELALTGLLVALLHIRKLDPLHSIALVVAVLFCWLLPNVFLWGQANRLEQHLVNKFLPNKTL